MPRIKHAFALTALALALAPAVHAAEFSNVVIFGDSLSDAGQYGARFTTNPGITAMEDVAKFFGFTMKPSTQGGTDFAYGGARVSQLPGVPATPPTATAVPIANQITTYLGANRADPNALYTVWGGANDIFFQVGLAGAGLVTGAQVQAAITTAASDELTQIARLHAAGARFILVVNLPDIGKTPFGAANPTAPFTALSGLYNSTLSAGLGKLGFDVIPVDAFTLLNEVLASPAQYGFTNTTVPACTTPSAIQCTPATLRDPGAANTWLFADGVHPTTAAHALLAQYAESIIEAPEKIGLLAEVPLQLQGSQRRAIESRYWSDTGPRARGKFDFYAAYDYNPSKIDRTGVSPGNDNTGHSLTVGGDKQITDSVSAGLAFGYSWNKSDFDNDAGSFKLEAPMLTAYTVYHVRQGYIAGSATVGGLDFRDVRRNVRLGQAVRTETGATKGTLQAYTVTGSYLFEAANLRHGPVGSLTYQKIHVDDYAENGANSTTMAFRQQERESFISSIGWQVSAALAMGGRAVLPFARVAYEHESRDNERSVRANLITMGGSFSMPVFKPGDNWTRVDLGASTQLGGRVTGYVAYSGAFGQSNERSNALTLGVKVPL